MKGYATARRSEGYRDGYKQENEDRAEIFEAGDALILVVADGVGGRPLGGPAAQRVVDIIGKAIRGDRPNDEAQIWAERLAGIDRMLSRDKNVGETTAVVAAVTPGKSGRIVGASVGDSGAWLIGEEEAEELTRRQAHKPYLGSGAALPVPFEATWQTGTLLLGTDGLHKYAEQARLMETAREADLEQAAQKLIELVRLPGGTFQDDVTLILCRSDAKPTAKTTTSSDTLLKTVSNLFNWGRRDK